MITRFRNIAATVISVAIFAPLALKATAPQLHSPTDYELRHDAVDDLDNSSSASAFLTLDTVAIEELADYGIEFLPTNDELASHIIEYATQHLGRPYRAGGKTPSGFDCSGFTSYVFRKYGIELSPSSRTQYTQGYKIDKDDIRPGDLLFFGGRAGGKAVGHVAVAVDVDETGKITFIHSASNKGIRYDTYPDGGYYSKRFLGARRVIQSTE